MTRTVVVDRFHAQHVTVGEGAAGFPGGHVVVVFLADDQVPHGGAGITRQRGLLPRLAGTVPDHTEVNQVIPDPPRQLPATLVIKRHQGDVLTRQPPRHVGPDRLVHQLVRGTTAQAGVLVILG